MIKLKIRIKDSKNKMDQVRITDNQSKWELLKYETNKFPQNNLKN